MCAYVCLCLVGLKARVSLYHFIPEPLQVGTLIDAEQDEN